MIRPSVRCALRCSVRAKLVVSRATARKLKLSAHARHVQADAHDDRRGPAAAPDPGEGTAAAKRAGLKTIKATLTLKATHAAGARRPSGGSCGSGSDRARPVD